MNKSFKQVARDAKESKPTHTPTPWVKATGLVIRGKGGLPIAQILNTPDYDYNIMDSNADLLVRAVNAHEALLAVVKLARNLGTLAQTHNLKMIHDLADQALAQAEKGR